MDLKESDLLGAAVAEHWYYRAKAAAVRRLLRGQKLAGILDVGAGSGYFSRDLLKSAHADQAWCVDTGYAEASREHCPGGTLHFERQLPAVPADLILLMDVLEHVDDDLALLQASVAASIAAQPLVLISVPAFGWLWSGHDEFLGHRRRYRLPEVTRLARRAGLTIEQACYYYGLVLPLAVASRLSARFVGRGRPARSQLRMHSAPVNRLLLALCQAELPWLRYNRFAGLSVLCLARRTGG